MKEDADSQRSSAIRDLASLVPMHCPDKVHEEALSIMREAYPDMDTRRIEQAYDDVVTLFCGENPEFQGCNTEYHDLNHTTDVYLTYARLVHGFVITGLPLYPSHAELGLVAALLHDTGYIQRKDDTEGTGAKYTVEHVDRSICFAQGHLTERGFSTQEAELVGRFIMATNLSVKLSSVPFDSEDEARAGKALFTSDILGQMADRVYLEKLLFLYREFVEGRVMGFDSELDLLQKTTSFYRFIWARLVDEVGYDPEVMRAHFRVRNSIDADLYHQAVRNNLDYLTSILEGSPLDYRSRLNREGLVRRIREIESSGNS